MKSESKNILNIFLGLVVLSSLLFSIAPKISAAADGAAERADIKYVPLAPIAGTFDPADKTTNLGTYLVGIFRVGVAVAGVLAFLMIVWGGFTYLSTDAITGKEEGKERITRAIGGLVLALASYIILNTIDTSLVKLNLDFGPPAEAAKDNARPSDLSYSEQFDAVIEKLNKQLDAANLEIHALEQVVTDATVEKQAILQASANAGNLELTAEEEAKVKALDKKISDGASLVNSTRDYNAALVNIEKHGADIVRDNMEGTAWYTDDTRADLDRRTVFAIETIKNNTKKALNSLNAAKAKVLEPDEQKRKALQDKYDLMIKTVNDADTKSIANICATWGVTKTSPPC